MAAAFVRKITGSGANVDSISLVFGANNDAGNAIFLAAGWYDPGAGAGADPASGNVTDSRNTYALDVFARSVDARAGIWSALNVGAGANTVVFDPPAAAGEYIEAVAAEFSGVATSGALDKTASNTGTSTTPTSGTTAATAQADELAIAAVGITASLDNIGIDQPSGWTNLHLQQNGNVTEGMSADYLILSTTGAQSASWGTIAASSPWAGCIATYKASSGQTHALQGAPAAQATATGVLTTEVRLNAAAAAVATALGHINAVLQGAALGRASAAGGLGGAQLAGIASAQALAAATLTGIAAALQGAAQAQASAAATFGDRRFRFPLANPDTSPLANKTGLWWAWFPSIEALRAAAIAAGGAAGVGAQTNATGVFDVPAPSSLSVGDDQGFGIVSNQDATADDVEIDYTGSFDVV